MRLICSKDATRNIFTLYRNIHSLWFACHSWLPVSKVSRISFGYCIKSTISKKSYKNCLYVSREKSIKTFKKGTSFAGTIAAKLGGVVTPLSTNRNSQHSRPQHCMANYFSDRAANSQHSGTRTAVQSLARCRDFKITVNVTSAGVPAVAKRRRRRFAPVAPRVRY